MGLPRSGAIRKAFKTTIREVKLAIKEMNGRAGRFLGRGDYVRSQRIMEQAKQVQQFCDELQGFQKRLSLLRGGGSGPKLPRTERHSDWEYYPPILQCLIELNCDATRGQLEKLFEQRFASWLKPGDQAPSPRGEPRWKLMIGRSKKHLIAEGFVAAPNLLTWRITPAGRKAAQQDKPIGK